MSRKLTVEIVGDSESYERAIGRVGAATKVSEGHFAKLSKAAGVAGLAIGGGLVAGLALSVKAAMAGQASQAALGTALLNTGQSVAAMTPALDAAEAASRRLGFADDDSRTALAKLEIATGSTSKAITDLTLAEDIARLKHTDLDTATKVLTGTLAGSSRAAKQLGISIQAVTPNMDALRAKYGELGTAIPPAEAAQARFLDKQATGAATLQAVTDKVHGQAQAFSETAAGGMEQFHAQLNHLEETMGSGLLPAITAVAEKLSNLGSYLSQHTTLAKALVVGLGALSVTLLAVSAATSIVSAAMGIAKVATATWTAAQWALNVALDANPIGVVIMAVAALTAAIIVAYQHSETFRKIVGEALDFVKEHALALSFVFGGPLAAGVVLVYQHFGTLRSIAVGAMNAIGDAVAAMVALAIGSWNRMRAVGSAVFGAIEAFAHATAAAFNALVGAINAVVGALNEVIHVANEALGAIHAVTSAPGRAAGAVMGVIPHAAGGAVMAGASYLVGERGPELFVSGASGAIVPNSELGASGWAAGGTTNYTFNFPHYLGREQDLANAVRGALAKHKFRGGR